jgi:hypothetical protein
MGPALRLRAHDQLCIVWCSPAPHHLPGIAWSAIRLSLRAEWPRRPNHSSRRRIAARRPGKHATRAFLPLFSWGERAGPTTATPLRPSCWPSVGLLEYPNQMARAPSGTTCCPANAQAARSTPSSCTAAPPLAHLASWPSFQGGAGEWSLLSLRRPPLAPGVRPPWYGDVR